MDNEHLTPTIQLSQDDSKKLNKKCFLNSAWWPFISFLLFSLVYILVFIFLKPNAIDIINPTIAKIFKSYSLWFGTIFAFLIMLSSYILYGLKNIFRGRKFYFLNPLLLLIAVLPWFVFAYELLYKEKRYTDIGKGLITYVGKPLWISTEIFLVLGFIWFIVSLIIFLKKK